MMMDDEMARRVHALFAGLIVFGGTCCLVGCMVLAHVYGRVRDLAEKLKRATAPAAKRTGPTLRQRIVALEESRQTETTDLDRLFDRVVNMEEAFWENEDVDGAINE